MSMANYLEEALLNNLFRNTNFAPPANVYISLHTADPGETGANEVSGGSYARVAVSTTGGWTDPSAGTQGEVDNVADITFPTATASWGTVTHCGIYDAATVGNLLWSGALTASKTVDNGDTFKFNAGDFNVQLD